MRALLAIFVVLMVAKDLPFVPFPYVLRAIAQGVCLAAGAYWIISAAPAHWVRRYWTMLGFLLVVLITAPASQFPWFVLLQAGSLASAIVFAIAFVEWSMRTQSDAYRSVFRMIVVCYAIVCVSSLLLIKVRPDLVFGALYAGDATGNEIRFHGLLAKPAMLAAAAGLLAGFAALGVRNWFIKILLCAAGLLCVLLAQARSFWLALLVAGAATCWIYYPQWRMRAVGVACAAAVCMAFVFGSGSFENRTFQSFARLDTLTTLTGRTALWEQVWSASKERPLTGYGFTLGASGLPDNRAANSFTVGLKSDPMELSRQTMHNGYLQALMDAGVPGLFFYLATLVVALRRLMSHDLQRRYPEILFALVYLGVANVGESVIYSGSVFHSVCFWICAVMACGLRAAASTQAALPKEHPTTYPLNVMR